MSCLHRLAGWILAALSGLAVATFAGADEPTAPAPPPSSETQTALDQIQREAEQKRAERREMERLRREVDRGRNPSARRGTRAPLTQQQIRALRAQQRQQVQRALRGLPARPPLPARPFPGAARTFRTPNGGGFVAVWGIPVPMR
jgi:hypothetical protein